MLRQRECIWVDCKRCRYLDCGGRFGNMEGIMTFDRGGRKIVEVIIEKNKDNCGATMTAAEEPLRSTEYQSYHFLFCFGNRTCAIKNSCGLKVE